MSEAPHAVSEFPPLQGLWVPRRLGESTEVLEHFSLLPAVPVGILFLALTGMRDLEYWFADGVCRPQRMCTIESLDCPGSHIAGADLVGRLHEFEEGKATVWSWSELCALVMWSELRGAEVTCRWTSPALDALRGPDMPEACFFPWASPAWRHSLAADVSIGPAYDPYELALSRGLNPASIRGLSRCGGTSIALNASHLRRARTLIARREAVTRISGRGNDAWRLDRYFSREATGSSLGVSAEMRRFRAELFQWLRDANRDDDDLRLVVDALLHLRERTPCATVSCNSVVFRLRTRYPFSYQRMTLGELQQLLSLLEGAPAPRTGHCESERLEAVVGSRVAVAPREGVAVEARPFRVDLDDARAAAGTVFRIRARAIGVRFLPDIAVAETPRHLSAIVREYERATGRAVVVAVNGGYFLDERTVPAAHPEWLGKPIGLLKCGGRLLSGPFYAHRPILCVSHEHRVALRRVSEGLCSHGEAPLGRAYAWSDAKDEYLDFRAAIEAGPLLISAGRPALDLDVEQWGSPSARAIQAAPIEMADLRTSRTAIAASRDGDVYLATVRGRAPESVGMTHEELAHWLCRELPDVDWAMEMDAGGSTTAWHVDAGVTTFDSCVGGVERPVASAVLFSVAVPSTTSR